MSVVGRPSAPALGEHRLRGTTGLEIQLTRKAKNKSRDRPPLKITVPAYLADLLDLERALHKIAYWQVESRVYYEQDHA